MNTPNIAPNTAIALCEDSYTGQPALDTGLWGGASELATSAEFEGWLFCYDPESGRIDTINEKFEGCFAYMMSGATWEEA